MKSSNKEAAFIYLLLGLILVLLVAMYVRLNSSVKSTAEQLLNDKSSLVEQKLDNFFLPVHQSLDEEWIHGKSGQFDSLNMESFARHFCATIQSNPSIYAAFISDEIGDHKFVRKARKDEYSSDELWLTTEIFKGNKLNNDQDNRLWKYGPHALLVDSLWYSKSDYDPRERDWYLAATKSDTSICTSPYWFSGFGTLGITFSRMYKNSEGIIQTISLDITLESLSKLTSEMKVAETGKAFILTDSSYFVGLPSFKGENIEDSLKKYAFSKIADFSQEEVVCSYNSWISRGKTELAFEFEAYSENYWCKFTPYQIDETIFYLGVVAPENEIAGSIQQTKWLILAGMIFMVIFALILVQAYRSKRKANVQLEFQKDEIEKQKHIVDEKNSEIIDSINYAKRIQTAILPPDKEFQKSLPNSFVFYEPKDIVAGDFYWMQNLDNEVVLAAADCTGHGVPGALVSVICNNGLNRSVHEFGLTDPAEILNKTRELVISEFEKSEEEVKDGMDIALVSIQKEYKGKRILKYAGAHNPLWIIRKGTSEIEEIKADKQPIGKFNFYSDFTSNTIELSQGDRFYLFSDGFADQFGGPKGKKFKSSNFKKLLINSNHLSIFEQKTVIKEAFQNWMGNYEQLDDLCVIGVEA